MRIFKVHRTDDIAVLVKADNNADAVKRTAKGFRAFEVSPDYKLPTDKKTKKADK
jgi:hypothetical protein